MTTIRKAIGVVKDQTSIEITKVASKMALELKVAIVKATSHDDDPVSKKYIWEILNLTSYSCGGWGEILNLTSYSCGGCVKAIGEDS
ncbi:Putative clathrin assembly protein [Morus notabilis]|uniref:Putative clathrin assembly protein n=1 Tax=Morus notabilis TaxID=981085 RepID=W9S7C9_9ROSA|nr:Putative clathrin assembly protein [Morus notabilis]